MAIGQGIPINDGFDNYSDKPLDKKFGPWESAVAALAAIENSYRYVGLTIGIVIEGNVVEYWFKSATTDEGLVEKNPNQTPQTVKTEVEISLAPEEDGQTVFDISSEEGDFKAFYLNGIRQVPGIDFTIENKVITYVTEGVTLKTWHILTITLLQ